MVTVTLNENGQVTIPAKILKEGGLTKGTRIAIMEIGKRIILVPLPKDTLQALIGLEKSSPHRGDGGRGGQRVKIIMMVV